MNDQTSSTPRTRNAGLILSAGDLGLYAVTVFAWSTSWIAIKLQVGEVPAEVSVFWRFVVAAGCMIVWTVTSKRTIRFGWREHLRFALLGVSLFSVNYYCFYVGGQYLASGLLAVVFSLASVFNLLLGAALFREKIEGRVALGALVGFAGIALMFWPEIVRTDIDSHALMGFAFCVAGTLCFCAGNMVSSANQAHGLGVVSANMWGMIYGASFIGLIALVRGRAFVIDGSPAYILSLLWLAVVASVIAFASYLTLLGRIGAARAGYATVMFPVIALAISTVFEGYEWRLAALLGLMAVIAGNLIVLSGRRHERTAKSVQCRKAPHPTRRNTG